MATMEVRGPVPTRQFGRSASLSPRGEWPSAALHSDCDVVALQSSVFLHIRWPSPRQRVFSMVYCLSNY